MGLQYSWIEANLLGFFLVDVRNWSGKFDEIKEKFVINPAPIASQSSVYAGDHDELEIFLETRLISSRVDQKLSLKGRNTLVLKRKLGSESWAMDAIVEAIWWRRGGNSVGIDRGFNSATNQCEFGFNLASK